MSNMSRTPLLDRILPLVGLDAIFERDANDTEQLQLEQQNLGIDHSQPRASSAASDQPITLGQISDLLLNFRNEINQDMERRFLEETTINMRLGGHIREERFGGMASPIQSLDPNINQLFSPVVGNIPGSQGPSGPAMPAAPISLATDNRFVQHSQYKKISLISSELSVKFKISSVDKSFDNLHALSRALDASNLLALVDGSRLIPVQMVNNLNGYTPKVITANLDPLSLNKYTVLDEDDIGLYAHDESTAFNFMISFLHVDMKHILAASVNRKDPRKLFQDIQSYFRGNQSHHVDRAIESIIRHKINIRSFEKDIANFRIFISELSHAQSAEVPEQQKFSYLKDLLKQDSRQCLANAMDLARFNTLNFEKTVDLLISTHANQPVGTVRMAAMDAIPIKYCFKFQKGECIRKDCKYLHKIMSDQDKSDNNSFRKKDRPVSRFNRAEKKEKINSMKNNNSNGTNGMHNINRRIPPNTIPLSRAHQIHIGDPHGKVSIGNPQGYSLSQRKQFNSFQRAEIDNIKNAAIINSNIMGVNLPIHNINNNNSNNNMNGNFETWNNVSMQPFNNNNQSNNNMNYNNTYMNMFEAESSNESYKINIENLPTSSSIMSPMISRKDPSRSGPFMEDILYKNSFQSIKCAPNVMSAACLHSISMGEKFGQYVRNDRIILCRQSTTNPAEIKRYCNLFEWIEQYFIDNAPKNHMHQGSSMFMMGIYMHNQVVFSANVFFPYKRIKWGMTCYGREPFMRFIPRDRNLYDIPYGENGHYSTSINTIHTYYEIRADFDNLPWLKLKEHQRNFFMVCLYYDFMSFASKHLEIESTRLNIGIDPARIHILNQITQLDDQYDNKYNTMSVVLGSIIAKINPRAQFVTDKDANYTLQEDIPLSVYNKINEEYDYNFNDTGSLMKDKALVNNETYESPKNERRGRDEIDRNESNKKRKITKVAIQRYTLDSFVDTNDLALAPDDGFYPSSPSLQIPLLKSLHTSTDDQADRKKVPRSYNHMVFLSENNIRKKLIFEGHLKIEDSEESDDDSDDDSEESDKEIENESGNKNESDNLKSVNMFMVPNCITMSNMTSSTSWLIDSGAGLSGTNNRNLLSCPSSCRVPITPAFGEMITATSEGSIRDHQLGQLNIRALHVEKMHHNLLSVHQLCEGGDSRTKQIGVFTDEGCRFFPLDHCRDALKLLSSKPQTFYGLAKNGVYVYAPSDQNK